MQRLPVESSDIISIGYNAAERVLEIEFKENRVYQYFDVEPEVYQGFMRAESYGEYFYARINKYYRYQRIDNSHQETPDKVVFVTGNPRKFRALQEVLEPYGIDIEQLDVPVDEIQSHDTEKIAVHKARQAFLLAGRPVVVQDSFWNILALRGFPGAYMRYVNDWFKVDDFLALMKDKKDRTVIRTHTLIYYDGKRAKIFSKDFTATLATEPRGRGSAIDQIVIPEGKTKTIAQLHEAGISLTAGKDSDWYDFAKWYSTRRRMLGN